MKLTASAGSTVAPGTGGAGTLTVTNAVHLLGTTSVTLDVVNSTNTVLASGATITYGGALNETFANNSPVIGAAFKLFQAKAYAGAFSSIVPPNAGDGTDIGDTSALTTTGTASRERRFVADAAVWPGVQRFRGRTWCSAGPTGWPQPATTC